MMYSWIKAFHIASVMTWIGGMLIMALALQVAQRSVLERSSEARLLQAVRRWDQRVTSPALGLAWILGIALVYFGQWHAAGWLIVKLVFVLMLSALHGMQSAHLRRLADAPELATSALLKNSGLLTLVAVVVIAVMVVLKPF
ncbi:putative membrane protein [Herbaspirillum sp. CF444]|uniref:CopD family protein n=1 Tax=Herbaspirillum sp. CF444 TaxID=1144319 RepID=UPI0002725D7B|nr:CopD family protein [Herbaspirillum sp. CF444]EJL88902.1 putative membrane protein [Herbaspirillum sp. CF444]